MLLPLITAILMFIGVLIILYKMIFGTIDNDGKQKWLLLPSAIMLIGIILSWYYQSIPYRYEMYDIIKVDQLYTYNVIKPSYCKKVIPPYQLQRITYRRQGFLVDERKYSYSYYCTCGYEDTSDWDYLQRYYELHGVLDSIK